MPDHLYVRLLRPLLGLIVKRHRCRGQPTVLDPVPPYAYGRLVKSYAGSPIGAIWRERSLRCGPLPISRDAANF